MEAGSYEYLFRDLESFPEALLLFVVWLPWLFVVAKYRGFFSTKWVMKELITTNAFADPYLSGSPPSLELSDEAFTPTSLGLVELRVTAVAQEEIKENATQSTAASPLLRLSGALWDRNARLKVG